MIYHALTSLGIRNGASHSEFKINNTGEIKIIEIGGRMGGDFIGSTLVFQSTGVDFLKAVIDVALGVTPKVSATRCRAAGVRFVLSQNDLKILKIMKEKSPKLLLDESLSSITNDKVTDSSTRFGYWIMVSDYSENLYPYLPKER